MKSKTHFFENLGFLNIINKDKFSNLKNNSKNLKNFILTNIMII